MCREALRRMESNLRFSSRGQKQDQCRGDQSDVPRDIWHGREDVFRHAKGLDLTLLLRSRESLGLVGPWNVLSVVRLLEVRRSVLLVCLLRCPGRESHSRVLCCDRPANIACTGGTLIREYLRGLTIGLGTDLLRKIGIEGICVVLGRHSQNGPY